MKRYLNRKEKNDALTLGAFVAFMDGLIQDWQKVSKNKEAIKYLKVARSFGDKALSGLLEGLDPLEIIKVAAETKKMKVVTKYNDQALREFEEMKKADAVTPVETEDFLDIIANALAVCQGTCNLAGEAVENCGLRKLFLKYDIEPFDLEAEPGKCPYK